MKNVFTLLVFVLLSACGGGDGSESTPNKSNQVIEFELLGTIEKLYDDDKFFNTASGGQGVGSISYSSSDSNIASVNSDSGEITILAVGSTTITANKAADINFNAASTSYVLNVGKANQSIIFSDASPVKVLVNDNYINSISGVKGNVRYQSGDPDVASVGNDGVVTLLKTGEVQITVSVEESTNYHGAEQAYLLEIAPRNIQVNALVGTTDAQLTFSAEAQGLTLLRTTDENCDLEDIYNCAEGQSEVISEFDITDTALTIDNAAFYTIQHDTIESEPKMINGGEMGPRTFHQAVDFKGKIWLVGGSDDTGKTSRVVYSDDGNNWIVATQNAGFSGRDYGQVVVHNNKMWLIGGSDETGHLNDVWSSVDGISWQLESDNAAFSKRIGHQVVAFNNKIWLTGGWDYAAFENKNDVWSSVDGINWTLVTENAGFTSRARHQSVVFNNKIWVIGGQEDNGYASDVWYSEDGINWSKATDSWGDINRQYHQSVAFDNKLWIIGGYQKIYSDNGSYLKRYNDIWSSTDGVNWSQITTSADFSARSKHEVIAFKNKLWLLGGYDDNRQQDDVWSSEDGIDWNLHSTNPPLPARKNHQAIAFNNKFWQIGGMLGQNSSNDVWSSDDGFNWTLSSDTPGFQKRSYHQAVVFKDKLFVIGGVDLSEGESTNLYNVWSSSDGINWSQVSESNNFPGVDNTPQVTVFDDKLWLIESDSNIWTSIDGVEWIKQTNTVPFSEMSISHFIVFNEKLWAFGVDYIDGSYKSYTWSSSDGTNWKVANENTTFAKTGHQITVFNDKLWLTAGEDLNGERRKSNEVWISTDGIEWKLTTANANFSARVAHQATVFRNKLWLTGGLSDLSLKNDIWVSDDGNEWRKAQRYQLSFD